MMVKPPNSRELHQIFGPFPGEGHDKVTPCLVYFSFVPLCFFPAWWLQFLLRRMVTIEDLLEDVLLEILSLVPRKDLILNCRLVCSRWRDLVDLPTLWRRKCQKMGFYPETLDDTFQDWRTFCFLKCKRNLVMNSCGEDDLYYWQIDWPRWTTSPEILPTHIAPPEKHYFYRPYRQMPCPPQDIQRCFLFTSPEGRDEHFLKVQFIYLCEEGFSDQMMDEVRPIIRVKDWQFLTYLTYHPSPGRLIVKLLSDDLMTLQECCLQGEVYNCWNELSHTFDNYPPGVRIIALEHEGTTRKYVKITGTSVTLDPEEVVPKEPQALAPPNLPKMPSFFSCFPSLLRSLKRKKVTS